jgi:peptide/nickel transport system permease protein
MRSSASHPRWLLRRFALAAFVVVGVATLTFILIHAAPGDPIYVLAGDGGTPEYYADMRAKYGLDRPLLEQFGRYARAVAVADFGYSFMYQAPVVRVLVQHAPASLLLGFTALVLATCGGFIVGTFAGARPNGAFDQVTRALGSVMYSAPVFWIGQVLIILIAVKLRLLPAGGFTSARADLSGLRYAIDVGKHLVLPAVALSLPFMAVVARVTRTAIADALHEPFVLAARARGIPARRVLMKHAAVSALVPVIALVGEHAAGVVAGAALTEALFGWPGLGYLVLHASLHRDYPLVTATFIVISSGVVFFNAATDVACSYVDPRIALS